MTGVWLTNTQTKIIELAALTCEPHRLAEPRA
jgi:hypothetical protein